MRRGEVLQWTRSLCLRGLRVGHLPAVHRRGHVWPLRCRHLRQHDGEHRLQSVPHGLSVRQVRGHVQLHPLLTWHGRAHLRELRLGDLRVPGGHAELHQLLGRVLPGGHRLLRLHHVLGGAVQHGGRAVLQHLRRLRRGVVRLGHRAERLPRLRGRQVPAVH